MFQYLEEIENYFYEFICDLNNNDDANISLFNNVNDGDFFQNINGYLINRGACLFQLVSPFAKHLFFPFMIFNLYQDFLCLLGGGVITYEILTKQMHSINALNIPILLVLGAIDLCFNVIVLALSLITRSISTLIFMAAFQLNLRTVNDSLSNKELLSAGYAQ